MSEIIIRWRDGRPELHLDNDASLPGDPTVLDRLVSAHHSDAAISIGGCPCKVVEMADQGHREWTFVVEPYPPLA